MGRRTGVLAIVGALLLAAALPAGAEEAKPPRKARRGPAQEKVIALEGDEIVGKVPKPQVFYVLGRAPNRYRIGDVKRSFVRRIVTDLKRNPL